MAEAILKFNLSDPDDRVEFERTSKSLDMALSLWEFGYNTKKGFERELESDEKTTDREFELLDKVYQKFWDILNEHNINIDSIVQ
jgi:hypothetical protein